MSSSPRVGQNSEWLDAIQSRLTSLIAEISLVPSDSPTTSTDWILFILACFVPPGAVYAKRRLQPDFWWSILLWCILWFPG